MRYIHNTPFETDRDVTEVNLYDADSYYDQSFYMPDINDGPGQVIPYEFDKVSLKVISNVNNYTVKLNGIIQNNILVERFKPISYSVIHNNKEKSGWVVCNTNKVLSINF